MHVGGARRHTHTGCCNTAIGDVDLAAVLRADGVAFEFEIAAVDSEEARALADNRFIAALQRKSPCDGIVRRKATRARAAWAFRARRFDAVARTRCNDTGRSEEHT